MANGSHIEWTQATWNPVTGCSKISAGCKNCYAERLAKRLQMMGASRYRSGFELKLHEDSLELPKKWKKPRLIFVNSMSDLFHKDVPFEFISKVFQTIHESPQHTFQLLTKRSARLAALADKFEWPANLWTGVSVEDRKAISRIEDLRRVPTRIRFLSVEPLIGPLGSINLNGIHWVIVGGESGPKARPMDASWVEEVFDQCRRAAVPFFFKQWGGIRKDLTGRLLHNRTYDEMPSTLAS